MSVNVSSETGLLKGVIVHTPGEEVSLVTPDIKNELLFDDIIYEENAKEEHLEMLRIMKVFNPDVKILEVADLFVETFQNSEAREYILGRLFNNFPQYNLFSFEKELLDLSPESLTRFLISGQTAELPKVKLLPSPNLLFTRDLAAVVGNNVVISRAALTARIRESYLMDSVVRYHPLYESVRDNVIRISGEDSIEGGDILVASDNLVLIGMSERTSFSGVMRAGKYLLEHGVKQILIVDIPKQRSSMHLDTIFTFSNNDECIAYAPSIMKRENNVVSLTMDDGKVHSELKPSLKAALEEALGHEFTFIECGGNDLTTQKREQWTDGANVFALAPGVVIGYERNTHTLNEMKKYGYEVVTGREFLEEYFIKPYTYNPSQKIAISFEGNELCRGRGGARCMTQPFLRDKIN